MCAGSCHDFPKLDSAEHSLWLIAMVLRYMGLEYSTHLENKTYMRQLEQDIETVVQVLQPGRLGIIEHKFTADEINKAKSTVNRAEENWRRNAYVERNSRPFLRDFIGHDNIGLQKIEFLPHTKDHISQTFCPFHTFKIIIIIFH